MTDEYKIPPLEAKSRLVMSKQNVLVMTKKDMYTTDIVKKVEGKFVWSRTVSYNVGSCNLSLDFSDISEKLWRQASSHDEIKIKELSRLPDIPDAPF